MKMFETSANASAGSRADTPSKEMLQALADGMPQLAWSADKSGSIQWYNKRWFDYTGLSPDRMHGAGWWSAVHPAHLERVKGGLSRALEDEESWKDTFPLLGKDGQYRWFLTQAEPVRDGAGHSLNWFCTFTDVTEQMILEERGRVDGERIRLALAAGAILGTWFWDLRSNRFTIDEQFAYAFGIVPWRAGEELPLEEVLTNVHPEDKPGLETAIAEAMAKGGRYAHQYRVRRADGIYHWIEANGRVDRAPDGTPIAFPGVLIDVEESRAMAATLRDTSRRLNAILNNTQMAVFLMNERQQCVYANAAAERLTGYSIGEMRGRALHDVVHHKKPDGSHYPIEECPIDRAFPERAQMQGEELFVAPDGSFYPVRFTASPIVDEAGRPVGTVIEARNIAQDKAREAELRESEARQRSILNAIPQMVWTTRPDGYHDFFNDRWYEFTGVPYGSTDGEGWNDVFHPDDQQKAWSLWDQCLASGEPYQVEYRLRHRSGSYRWTLGRALPVHDSDGKIVRWIGTCTDIHDLRQTADELRRTSMLLRLIGGSTPDLIYAKDLDGLVLYANAAVQRAVGKPIEEIVGFSDLDFALDKAQARAVMANDRLVVETGETLDVDEIYTNAEGHTSYFRSVKAPLRDELDRIVGIVGVTSDVTKRREAEERERLLAREVDHRAKNMLAVVQALVNLTKGQDPGSFKKAVAGRIQALARAHDLLVKSRWEGVSLRELVDQELAAFTGKDGSARVAGPGLLLPPAVAQSLSLVLHELATNAAKYGSLSRPGGQLALSWKIDAKENGQASLRLSWQETGGPTVSPPASAGFGSALIRSSVERQLRGELTREWRPSGLVCEIRVPATQMVLTDEVPPLTPTPARVTPKELSMALKGKPVLVVEDEALIAMEMETMLLEAGCEVLGPASSVDEALRLLAGSMPAAALLDVNLGGREFSYKLADALVAKGVPFAFCTGYAGVSELPARFGDTQVLAKPLDHSTVIATVSILLNTARQ